jgi:hypothetical protein
MQVSKSVVMALEIMRLYGLQHRDDDKDLRAKYQHVLDELTSDSKRKTATFAALTVLECASEVNEVLVAKSVTALELIRESDGGVFESLNFLFAAYEPQYWYW